MGANETMASAVYAISTSNNQWDLVLNVFDSSATGEYTCRRVDDQVSLSIAMSKWCNCLLYISMYYIT